ncbi:MAG: hypothetical protein U9P10_11700, partial [Thermodesulfobacteriota bacterium]|nr:hypothetical protein [Thermodesulfobacteriota bacterium]
QALRQSSCLRTSGRRSPIFSLAGKKSSVVLVPDRQPLGAALFCFILRCDTAHHDGYIKDQGKKTKPTP